MKKLFILLIVFLIAGLSFAGDKARKGTTGADELLIPVGARGIATGEAFLSSVMGLEAIYYNPAGLAFQPGSEVMFSYMTYIADINISYFAIGTNLDDLGSFAFSLKSLDFGDIPVTTFESPDGTGASYSPSFIIAGISYSKVITDRVSIGINTKLISESILEVSATGFALDFGVQYRFSNRLSIGATVKNIGTNMTFSGSNMQVRTSIPGAQEGTRDGAFEVVAEAFQLPSYFELSAGYLFDFNESNQLQVASTFRNNNALEDQMKIGLEYGFANAFFVRGGYNLMLQGSDDSIFRFSLGAGINYNFSEFGAISFDYAYRDVNAIFDSNHIVTLKIILE